MQSSPTVVATLKRSFRVLCFLYQNHCLVICLILLLEKISFQLFDKKAKILFFQFFGRRLEMFVMIVINSKILGYCGFNRKKSLYGFLGWWLEYILFVDNELHSIVWKKSCSKKHEKTCRKRLVTLFSLQTFFIRCYFSWPTQKSGQLNCQC